MKNKIKPNIFMHDMKLLFLVKSSFLCMLLAFGTQINAESTSINPAAAAESSIQPASVNKKDINDAAKKFYFSHKRFSYLLVYGLKNSLRDDATPLNKKITDEVKHAVIFPVFVPSVIANRINGSNSLEQLIVSTLIGSPITVPIAIALSPITGIVGTIVGLSQHFSDKGQKLALQAINTYQRASLEALKSIKGFEEVEFVDSLFSYVKEVHSSESSIADQDGVNLEKNIDLKAFVPTIEKSNNYYELIEYLLKTERMSHLNPEIFTTIVKHLKIDSQNDLESQLRLIAEIYFLSWDFNRKFDLTDDYDQKILKKFFKLALGDEDFLNY